MLAQYRQWCYLSQRVMVIPLTLKVTTAQVVETPVTVNRNSPIQDYVHADNHTQPTYEKTPGFKPFTVMIMMEYSENLPLQQFLTLILLLQGVDQTPEKSQIKVWHQIGHEFSILVVEKDKAISF